MVWSRTIRGESTELDDSVLARFTWQLLDMGLEASLRDDLG